EEDDWVAGRDPGPFRARAHDGARAPRLHGPLDGARSDGDDDDEPQEPEEDLEVRGVVGLVLLDRQEPAAQSGDPGREGEGDDARPGRIDADGGGRRLTAAQRIEISASRSLSYEDHTDRDHGA